jgi:hypothetical protein
VIVLERHGLVLLSLLVLPSYYRLPLSVEAEEGLDDLVLKQVIRVAQLLEKRHLVLPVADILNAEVPCALVLPAAFSVELV